MDELWVTRSSEVMLDTFHWFRGEGVDLGMEDLVKLVAPLLGDRTHAVWLLPSPAFRHAAITGRGTVKEIPGRKSDPGRALHNLLRRDDMFTDQLRAEIGPLDLASIDVDLPVSEDKLVNEVAVLFGLVA